MRALMCTVPSPCTEGHAQVFHPVPGGARQVRAALPLQARVDGRAVLPGLPVPTAGLGCAQHAAMKVCVWQCMRMRALRASPTDVPTKCRPGVVGVEMRNHRGMPWESRYSGYVSRLPRHVAMVEYLDSNTHVHDLSCHQAHDDSDRCSD